MIVLQSSLGLNGHNSSTNEMDGDSQKPISTSCSGVRFDQHATVYSNNGSTTTTAIDSKSDLVNIQINIEQIDDDEELDEDETPEEDEYYNDDDDDDEDEDDDDDQFEEEEMAVIPTINLDNNRCSGSRRQRLKNLFNFHSHNSEPKSVQQQHEHYSSFMAGHDNQQIANNGKVNLTRSSSLQVADVAVGGSSGIVAHQPQHQQDQIEPINCRSSEVDFFKFKRSSIAGFTVPVTTGPLGLFKTQPRHYEETHL